MPHTPPAVPAFTRWPSFPFEGEFRVKKLDDPVPVEPPRKGEDGAECISCNAPDDAYIWVSERWRVRAMDRPSGLPMVLILESRSHLDLGDLPNLLAAELGVMTVRLERAVRSLDGVARVHVNRWGDGSAHLHMWFLARPYGQLQLRGTFLSLWDDILPPIPESQWRENLALVAAWLAEFGGRPLAEPPRIQWQAPSSLTQQEALNPATGLNPATTGPEGRPEGYEQRTAETTPLDDEPGPGDPEDRNDGTSTVAAPATAVTKDRDTGDVDVGSEDRARVAGDPDGDSDAQAGASAGSSGTAGPDVAVSDAAAGNSQVEVERPVAGETTVAVSAGRAVGEPETALRPSASS